jgi:hypothetical protein
MPQKAELIVEDRRIQTADPARGAHAPPLRYSESLLEQAGAEGEI